MAAAESYLRVTVQAISGEVLLGPSINVNTNESTSDLKRRLPDHGGAWRLLLKGRELLDRERLSAACEQDAENEITAVALQNVATDLSRLLAETIAKRARLYECGERWLRECDAASDDRKQQQRKEDIQLFMNARETLLQEIEEQTIFHCKKDARMGRNSSQVHLENLQAFELGAKFFFAFNRTIRQDPIMRGWYYSMHDDAREPRDVPETIQMRPRAHAEPCEEGHHRAFSSHWPRTWSCSLSAKVCGPCLDATGASSW
eukprot:TRINITY_DN63401_c0_g1_i1.p1 TRINITY_DN63401_c0_g1~~TRINITY_DN63401_c0_g1_i1.p1  ORF type:complete len:260 (-),score=43.99 TRINITY_DN63401_c0_g1_i1:57-836(-)